MAFPSTKRGLHGLGAIPRWKSRSGRPRVRLMTADEQNPTAGSTAAQAPYQRIRDDIITGLLRPDEKLKIRDLRVRYQTGSSPLREALSTLTADGLVTRTENRGFRVARADVDAYEDLVQARCWIEGIALRESIAQGTTKW